MMNTDDQSNHDTEFEMPNATDVVDEGNEYSVAESSSEVLVTGEQFLVNPEDIMDERILLPDGCTRSQAVATLMQRARTNEFGLPTSFIRSDLLPTNLGLLYESDVESASEGLFYFEGYPTLSTGQTFWHQLPHEPYEAYILFTQFIEQAEELGIRQLDLLAVATNQDLDILQDRYHEYLWGVRARSHDVFCTAAEQKKRVLRTRKAENKHYDIASTLMDTLMQKFEDSDWIEELDAKAAIEVLESLVKIQRLSLGLTGQHASSMARDRLPDGASSEAIIRQITRNSGMDSGAQDNFADKLSALISNPEDGMVVQEAILRVGRMSGGSNSTFSNEVMG